MMNTIIPKHLWFIAGGFWVAAFAIVVVGALIFSSNETKTPEDQQPIPQTAVRPLPASFIQPLSLQDGLHSSPFRLASIDRPIRLPDLRSSIMYYGSNERPDRALKKRRIQYGMRGTQILNSAVVGEKIYFKFDGRTNKWGISDSPTPLSAVFSLQEPNVQVTLEFQDINDVRITVPSEFHNFSLPPSPPPASVSQPHQWLVGSSPVDNSLLDRQGAVWWGQDEVVLAFGGDEMEHEASRQRVQFGGEEGAYVLWVGEGDCFAYDDDRWKSMELGSQTIGKPLLQVKSIDERAIHFQLWNPEGTWHHPLDLIHREAQGDVKIPEIKIIGARSKNSWIAEIQGKRVTLKPDDWLLLQQNGFVQIDNEQVLDAYLQGRLSGNLLVFSGIEKVEGELSLVGTFYDFTRTRQAPFAISLYRSWGKKDRASDAVSSENDDAIDDSDDEIDDDDEIIMDDDDDDEDS
jgi:hypothetical protein